MSFRTGRNLKDDSPYSTLLRSHNELRRWFPSLKNSSQLRLLRLHSSTYSPSSTILEIGQYFIAVRHHSNPLGQQKARLVMKIAESLIKTSLAELMLASKHSDEDLVALQLVSFFQLSGSISLTLLSASTRAARLAMLSSPSTSKKLAWCSASVWEACIALGVESGIQLYRPDKDFSSAFIEDLAVSIDHSDVGVHGILMRGRNLAAFNEIWQQMLDSACFLDNVLTSWNALYEKALLKVEELGELAVFAVE